MDVPVAIPRQLSHIWIGPFPEPREWTSTWAELHHDWEYTLYDNHYLATNSFENGHLIDEYLRRGRLEGVADLMRYEILYEHGGLMPEADSICLRRMDELLHRKSAYTVYENEFLRGKLVSPILACEPKNPFVGTLIKELHKLKADDLAAPWKCTGNLFVAKMIERYQPDVVVWPSYYLIPEHKDGLQYTGSGPIYAKQMWGTTKNLYGNKSPRLGRIGARVRKFRKRREIHSFGKKMIKSRARLQALN